jgi:hypothetical protein
MILRNLMIAFTAVGLGSPMQSPVDSTLPCEFIVGSRPPTTVIGASLDGLSKTARNDFVELQRVIAEIRQSHGESMSQFAIAQNGHAIALFAADLTVPSPTRGVWVFPSWRAARKGVYVPGYKTARFACNGYVILGLGADDTQLICDISDMDVRFRVPKTDVVRMADNGRFLRISATGNLVGELKDQKLTESDLTFNHRVVDAAWLNGGSALIVETDQQQLINLRPPEYVATDTVPGQLSRVNAGQCGDDILLISRAVQGIEGRGSMPLVLRVDTHGHCNVAKKEEALPLDAYECSPSGRFALCIAHDDRRYVARVGAEDGTSMPVMPPGQIPIGWLACCDETSLLDDQ